MQTSWWIRNCFLLSWLQTRTPMKPLKPAEPRGSFPCDLTLSSKHNYVAKGKQPQRPCFLFFFRSVTRWFHWEKKKITCMTWLSACSICLLLRDRVALESLMVIKHLLSQSNKQNAGGLGGMKTKYLCDQVKGAAGHEGCRWDRKHRQMFHV